ncbi:C2 calcium-dependent domain-containing protein 4A-like [Sorex araneus]|uniref:C2 calcium-dependent domain-containing protein 4A-like n=1 Tax=Sorex araneus TaxID=42254 RepID=UPI002433AAA2|nr:C2 calcium-dependent domain-containing protein 4A-like [Sorex araneus]
MWFLERLRWDSERLLSPRNCLRRGRARRAAPATCANVLTPDRIPEFCIPPRLAPCAALAARLDSRGPPAGPDEGDGAGRTDWDPRSQAALSLPHLPRARTAYGFCALLESPHTRRKESLFLGSAGAAALLRPPAPARAHPRGGPTPAAAAPAPAAAAAPRAPRARRLLRAPEGLLSRALRARRTLGLARAHPGPGSASDDDAPRLPAASGRARGRLRLRLRGAQSLAAAPRAATAGRDRGPDGLSEDSGRRRAGGVRVEKRDPPLGRDEPPSGSLLLS